MMYLTKDTFDWFLQKAMLHCRRKNSDGRGGSDKEKRSRWLRRLELQYTRGKTVRSGGHQDRATSYWHGNRPHHTRMAVIIMATPAVSAEGPASGKQGCPEWHAEEMGGKQMRRTKGASRSRDRGIRCVREEGGRRRRTGKMRDTEQQERGRWRERWCLLNVSEPREQMRKHYLSLSLNH